MKLIVCLDEGMGMSFNRRRQTRDSVVTEDILKEIRVHIENNPSARAVMDFRSLSLFGEEAELADCTLLSQSMTDAEPDDILFSEFNEMRGFEDRVDTVIAYYWNRDYPRDVSLQMDLGKFIISDIAEMVGTSHDKIVKVILQKKER